MKKRFLLFVITMIVVLASSTDAREFHCGFGEIIMNKKSGEHVFVVTAKNIGTYRLVFTAKYINRPGLPERHEVFYLKDSA